MIEASIQKKSVFQTWKMSFFSLKVLHTHAKVCLQQSKSSDLIYAQFENSLQMIRQEDLLYCHKNVLLTCLNLVSSFLPRGNKVVFTLILV